MNSNPLNIDIVWTKGVIVPGYDPRVYRKDVCGAWIQYSEYGKRNSQNGWEIDHITPIAKNGNDHISNLRPLHWQNNASKSDGTLKCIVSAR